MVSALLLVQPTLASKLAFNIKNKSNRRTPPVAAQKGIIMRLVSLLPSATEMLDELGLAAQIVGISHACDYPDHLMHLPRVTSCIVPKDVSSLEIDTIVRQELATSNALYELSIPMLKALAPDLILTQALCDVCAVNGEDVEQAICSLPVQPKMINLEPFSLTDVLDTLTAVGAATDTVRQADSLRRYYAGRIAAVKEKTDAKVTHRPTTIVLDWVDPPFVSGHWMHDLITLAGGTDIMGEPNTPSWTATWEQIFSLKPKVLVIACCGFDVDRTLAELNQPAIKDNLNNLNSMGTKIHVFDGNALFSRPSLRLVDSLELLAHHLHPSVHAYSPPKGVIKPVGDILYGDVSCV